MSIIPSVAAVVRDDRTLGAGWHLGGVVRISGMDQVRIFGTRKWD
jgi:hypothetical protein